MYVSMNSRYNAYFHYNKRVILVSKCVQFCFMHLPTTLQNLNFVSGNTLHTRNLEKSPSKKQNITLDRNYSNAIGSSK